MLGSANLARTSRTYFCLLIHCFQLAYCYIWTKTSHNEKYARFYSSLYLKQVLHFRNQKSTFYYLFLNNQKYCPIEFKFRFSVCFSEISGYKRDTKNPSLIEKSVAHLHIWRNRYLKMNTNLNSIVLFRLWSVSLKLYFNLLLKRNIFFWTYHFPVLMWEVHRGHFRIVFRQLENGPDIPILWHFLRLANADGESVSLMG